MYVTISFLMSVYLHIPLQEEGCVGVVQVEEEDAMALR